MAQGQDFDRREDVPELPESAAPGQATDMSQQSGLRRAWDSWTSRPENNAAMINFGLSMMNPAPGNLLSNVGYGLGSAAEGMSANVKAQRERELEEQKSDIAEREEARKETETGYYGQSVRQSGAQQAAARAAGGITPLKMWQARLRAGLKFDDLLDKAGTGLGDTMWEEIQQKYPGKYKTKLDYKNSPQYQQDRQAYVKKNSDAELAAMDLSGGTGAAPGGAAGGVPEGTVIRRGSARQVMRNGTWVPLGE
jgi:hypothetical protein